MQHKINDMIHRQYLQKYEYTKMRLTCVLFKNKSLSDKYVSSFAAYCLDEGSKVLEM